MGKVKVGTAPKSGPQSNCPPNYKYGSIAEIFKEFQAKLEGKTFVDPCGQESRFFALSFPHLVKLEFFDENVGHWVPAKASKAVAQLRSGNLDESKYRIQDESRARTLFWLPEIIEKPDEIHHNIRGNQTEVYSKRYVFKSGRTQLKVVLVKRDSSGGAVITSFWCDHRYHQKCIKLPAKHP
jgi:hypothetical protein